MRVACWPCAGPAAAGAAVQAAHRLLRHDANGGGVVSWCCIMVVRLMHAAVEHAMAQRRRLKGTVKELDEDSRSLGAGDT